MPRENFDKIQHQTKVGAEEFTSQISRRIEPCTLHWNSTSPVPSSVEVKVSNDLTEKLRQLVDGCHLKGFLRCGRSFLRCATPNVVEPPLISSLLPRCPQVIQEGQQTRIASQKNKCLQHLQVSKQTGAKFSCLSCCFFFAFSSWVTTSVAMAKSFGAQVAMLARTRALVKLAHGKPDRGPSGP